MINKEGLGERGLEALLALLDRHGDMNPDGYALATDNGLFLRTLDITRFEDFLCDNEEMLKKAQIVHFHFRNATSEVNEQNIHLWNIGGYYCSHNGVVFTHSRDVEKCDSLEYFRSVEDKIASENWQAIANDLPFTGVFMLSRADWRKIVVISSYKPIYVLNNASMTAFLSADIIIKQAKELYGIELSRDPMYHGTLKNAVLEIDVASGDYKIYKPVNANAVQEFKHPYLTYD